MIKKTSFLSILLTWSILTASYSILLANNSGKYIALFPIFLVSIIIFTRLVLILLKTRPTFDLWAVFTYISFFLFIFSPLYHFFSQESGSLALQGSFKKEFIFVAWTSLPIFPLFFLGKKIASIIKRKNKTLSFTEDNFNETYITVKNWGKLYLFSGLISHLLLNIFNGNAGSLTGTLLLFADFFSVGLILLYYAYGLKVDFKQVNYNKKGFLFLILIMTLIFILNIDRGSRFFIFAYGIWGMYIYNKFFKKIKLELIIIIVVMLIPVLNDYKLFKYTDYEFDFFVDYSYRQEVKEEFDYRTPLTTIANDLGRYYIWMTYAYSLENNTIEYQYGKTYKDALLTTFPSWIINEKPPGIIEISTDAEYGRGYYEARQPNAAKIAGIWGESYINFGIIGVWILPILFGFLLQILNKYINKSRFSLFTPLLKGAIIILGAEILMHDMRLILWHVVRNIIPLIPMIYVSYKKSKKTKGDRKINDTKKRTISKHNYSII